MTEAPAPSQDQSRHDPWAKDCPSTHCNRSDECRSPSDCCSPTRPKVPAAVVDYIEGARELLPSTLFDTYAEWQGVTRKVAAALSAAAAECTCHPGDNPPRLCPQKHAYSECVKVALEAAGKEHDAALARGNQRAAADYQNGKYIGAKDAKAALLARLQEPDVIEAVEVILEPILPRASLRPVSRAIIAKIAEMLK